MVNQMGQLHFSREDESEADHYGLRYMAEAGYDPTAMLDVMNILKEASKGASPPEFLATHPSPRPGWRRSNPNSRRCIRRASHPT